ncbi:hypothetical protein [Campylobacter concisus]|uniref:hypothetical protein n=1 Tax=Campylobacter concisus TaxID=199 RepID=UPI000B330008|nr:hypothetical protein [Campylobacter concisus]
MSLLPNHKSKFDKKFDELFGVRFEDLDIGVINTLASKAPKIYCQYLQLALM